MRNQLRRAVVAMAAAAVVYILLLAFPEPLFSHSLTSSGITFYSRTPLPARAETLALAVREKISRAALNDPSVRHRVFIVNSPVLWALLNGPYRRAIARNVEIRNSILVPTLDWTSLDIVHFDGRRAPAVGILAHEITHTLVQRRIGLLAVWRLPWWKREGYAEYVGADSGNASVAPPAYQRAMLHWKALLEQRHLGVEEILRTTLPPPDSL